MITESRMRYHTSRTYALKELLDTTFMLAHEHAIEGTETPYDVLERIRDLLFCAHEVASGLATDLDSLIAQAEPEAPAAFESAVPSPSPANDDLHSLGLCTSTANRLRKDGISTVSQLSGSTELDLLRLPNIGRKSLNEVKEVLAANGLALAAGGEA